MEIKAESVAKVKERYPYAMATWRYKIATPFNIKEWRIEDADGTEIGKGSTELKAWDNAVKSLTK